jgi:hypothetical protein
MMMNSVATRDMRVLTDAEIAMVAGGPLGDLVNPGDMHWLDGDHTFLSSNGIIFADYTHDGDFEEAWRENSSCNSGYERSITGIMWTCSSSTPWQEIEEWLENHPTWHVVEG